MKSSHDEIKRINEELLLGETRYRFMLERSDSVIFEYTLASHTIEYSERFAANFGYAPITQNIPSSIVASKDVYEDDIPIVTRLFADIDAGKPETSGERRIRTKSGAYAWYAVTMSTFFGEGGIHMKALGIFENIDTQKKKEFALIAKAERDQLTDLYNKTTTETLIKTFLSNPESQNQKHALMIIDMDDFKQINDNLGHYYGDVVLSRLATTLVPIFRKSDVVGRIGGNEFFVFMKDIASISMVEAKVQRFSTLFHGRYSGENTKVSVTASVGIALFPADGKNFETLYRHADIALYIAKEKGKNCYSFYDETVARNFTAPHREHDAVPDATQRARPDVNAVNTRAPL